MSLRDRPQPDGVAYSAPFSQWVFGAMRVFLLFIVLTLVIGSAWLGFAVFLASSSNNKPPVWMLISSVILAAFAVIMLTLRLGRNEIRRRIVLGVDHLWIGGYVLGTSIPYESIRLVRLVHTPKSVRKMHQIVIELARRTPASIWLTQPDAEECFATLRDFCGRAAAIDKHETLHQPRDAGYEAEAALVLAASLRRRAFRSAFFCGLVLLSWSAMLAGILMRGGTSSRSSAPWHLMAVLPAIAFGMGAASLRDFRQAKRHATMARDAAKADAAAQPNTQWPRLGP